jgi:hypothetical protein
MNGRRGKITLRSRSFDEVASNWETLHAGAESCETPLDSINVEIVPQPGPGETRDAFLGLSSREQEQLDEMRLADNAERKTSVGRNINKFRKQCGLSIAGLGRLMKGRFRTNGMDRGNVSDHINDRTKPSPEMLGDYAKVFSENLRPPRTVSIAELDPDL